MNEILWLLAIIILIVGFFTLIFYLILRESGEKKGLSSGEGSLSILYDRYVKREITIDQYQNMRNELQKNSPENTAENFARFL